MARANQTDKHDRKIWRAWETSEVQRERPPPYFHRRGRRRVQGYDEGVWDNNEVLTNKNYQNQGG
jgi:hypothetical protein